MAKRYIYGTNRECTKYQFLIQSETDTEYHVIDVDMMYYDDVTFKVDKKTLKFTADNPRWQFIVDKFDFVASLDEKEIKKQADIYYLEYLESLLPKEIENVNKRQTNFDNFKQLEKVEVSLDDFNKLNIGDEIIVIDDNGDKKTAKCCSFQTIDKINFICDFDIDGKFISPVKQNYKGEFEINHECYDYEYEDFLEYTYSIYLNQEHLDYHLNQKEYEKIVSLLNDAKASLQRVEKQIAELRAKLKNE
jgi:hypothetical protein